MNNIFGELLNPLTSYGNLTDKANGLVLFISNITKLLFSVGGIVALFNFIIAGYQYMQAAGDAKQLQQAWSRIWQTLMGLILIVGSFALISLFSYFIFGDAGYILNPKICGPSSKC